MECLNRYGIPTGVQDSSIDIPIDMREFDGWEPRAAWDDFKLGLKHRRELKRIALVGRQHWAAAEVGSWFTSGEANSFSDMDDALQRLDDQGRIPRSGQLGSPQSRPGIF